MVDLILIRNSQGEFCIWSLDVFSLRGIQPKLRNFKKIALFLP